MGAKSEALAKQFEALANEALATLGRLKEADWKKVTAAEKWSVGVTAHHLAGGLEAVSNIVKELAAGRSLANFTTAMLDEMNAKHAKDHANCTRAETIELHKKGMVTAAATIRGLSDDQLAKSGTVFTGMPPMTAERLIALGLVNHITEHYDSIRETVSH